MIDPYEILGVRRTCSQPDIELAYRGRRTQYHPDKYATSDSETIQWATGKMQEVQAAYTILSNPTLRAQHDARAGEPHGPDVGNPKPRSSKTARGPSLVALTGDQERLELLRNAFRDLTQQSEEKTPEYSGSVTAEPLPQEISRSLQRRKRGMTIFVIAFGLIALAGIAIPALSFVSLLMFLTYLVAALGLVWTPRALKLERERRKTEVNKAREELAILHQPSRIETDAMKQLREPYETVQTALATVDVADLEYEDLRAAFTADGVEASLQEALIVDAGIAGVGPGRASALADHGIHSASDLDELYEGLVPGIGKSVIQSLWKWRERLESHYKPKLTMEQINQLNEIAVARNNLIEQTLREGEAHLRALNFPAYEASVKALDGLRLEKAKQLAQAKANLQLANSVRPAIWTLISLVIIFGLLFFAFGLASK